MSRVQEADKKRRQELNLATPKRLCFFQYEQAGIRIPLKSLLTLWVNILLYEATAYTP